MAIINHLLRIYILHLKYAAHLSFFFPQYNSLYLFYYILLYLLYRYLSILLPSSIFVTGELNTLHYTADYRVIGKKSNYMSNSNKHILDRVEEEKDILDKVPVHKKAEEVCRRRQRNIRRTCELQQTE